MTSRSSTLPRHPHTAAKRLSASLAPMITGVSLAVCLMVSGCNSDSTTVPNALAATTQTPSMSIGMGQNARPADSAAVAAVTAAWDAAWNAGNGAGIGALFLVDGEFINGRGQLAIGAATIGANHSVSLAGPFRGSHSQGTIRRITFLSENAAVLEVDNKLTGTFTLPGGGIPTFPGMNLGRHKRVLVKRAGHWLTMAMQITSLAAGSVAPPAP
ncbi:MAG: SgcJ/EcaC family oxidoreductase [Gemmatimonadaceae bacterium]